MHGGIGVVSFDIYLLKNNLEALISDLLKAKPASSKGVYMKKITLSSTMGPGIMVDKTSLNV